MKLRIASVAIMAAALPAFAAMGPNRLDGAKNGDWLTVSLSYSPSDLSVQTADGYDKLFLAHAGLQFNVGDPVVPVRHVRFALPIGYRAVAVQCVRGNPYAFGGKYRPAPGTPPQQLSDAGERAGQFVLPREGSAFRAASPFPSTAAKLLGTGSKSGYPIADVDVYPIQWDPHSGRLVLYRDIKVSVQVALTSTPVEAPVARSAQAESIIRDAVTKLVDNGADVPVSAVSTVGAADAGTTVEYLIITSPQLVSTFQFLADWKTMKGVPTQIVTTDWIYSTYTGELAHDGPDKIRQCIKDYWQNKGTIYVLLGGDVEILPYRTLVSGDAIPADLYYSDLQGSYDANGNGSYGEYPADGQDLYSDVYVGRAPVWTGAEASIFVFKVLQYESAPGQTTIPSDYERKALFFGNLWDASTDGKQLKELIAAESFPPGWSLTKLYESDGTLGSGPARNAMNQGQNLINHCGHANSDLITTDPDYLWSGDVYNLHNGPRYSAVLYSTGCDPGYFPENDCFGENFVLSPNGGGFFVGNSLAGWYYIGWPTGGLSQGYDRNFFAALLQAQYNYYPLGQVFAEHKDIGVPGARSNGTELYCHYCLNLLGDPEMPVWKHAPGTMTMTHPDSVYAAPSSFAVNVYDGSGKPLSGATVCLWKGTEEYEVGTTNVNGLVILHPEAATAGWMYVTATKPDYIPVGDSVHVNTCSVSGMVSLGGMLGSLGGRTITLEFRTPGTTNVVAQYNAVLNAGGAYSVYPVPAANYDIALKYCNWLRQVDPQVWVKGPMTANFTLTNGDANGDNAVNLLDLSMILATFGQRVATGDLNCDGNVNLLDLSIILARFGLHGDN